jgi:hypothetical protein
VEKNIYCRVKKRSLIRTLVIKKNDEKKRKDQKDIPSTLPQMLQERDGLAVAQR